ncbi:hypothetical protein GYMLUDRAFT_165532 [Collybiopsis luxurians FD-317 M1]|uniref:Uncharacterized protein n=1 Tax=Collybiopsis luxurians FD-317 M1 TaxID=944289 RepID=A0A0D0CGV1_9AGAR|nr:hypothetical protein GYMLUDRAFT_165532 [Collybiopsis luxurians FD-317 M1]
MSRYQQTPSTLAELSQSFRPPLLCCSYSSMQTAGPSGATNGYGSPVGMQGRDRVTTEPGFAGLTMLQRVNHTWLEHANSSLPQKCRPRGKAIRPPALACQERDPSVEDIIMVASGGEQVVNLDVLVYPPMPSQSDIKYLDLPNCATFYDINKDSFRMVLSALDLYHQYKALPISTTVFNLLSDITTKLRVTYNLPSVSSPLCLASHEALPIQLLGFSNRGQINGAHRSVKMKPMHFELNMTVQDLLGNRAEYAPPKLTITRDQHFQLHVVIRQYPLKANVSLSEVYLGTDHVVRPHQCLSKCIYKIFSHDTDANLNVHALDEELMEDECEEGSDNTQDEQVLIIMMVWPFD